MKYFKPSIILITLIIIVVILLNNRFAYILESTYPFVFDLKTKNTKTITYISDSNQNILPKDNNTFGVYSTRYDTSMLKSIFQTAGLPYIITDKLTKLEKCNFIFIDASLNDPLDLYKAIKKTELINTKRLLAVSFNGILNAKYGGLKKLFGYKDYKATKEHFSFHLKSSKFFKYFDTKEEKQYTISSINTAPYTNTIILGSAQAIALYDDMSPAITLNQYNKGYAINLGISLFDLRFRNLIDKDFYANKYDYNHFEPLSDFIILFLKGIYETSQKQSIILHTSKYNNDGSIILTHNIDSKQDLKYINQLVTLENSLGITPTCFINPKYYSDTQSNAYFMPKNFKFITSLKDKKVDFGVYSNPQKENFFLLEKGTCKESYPSYQQFRLIDTKELPTVCGEAKIPKELLNAIGISNIVNFRSGNLLYNQYLPEVLPLFGYKYSSSFFAEDIMSYFPFRYPKDYDLITEEGKIYEIPVSFKQNSLIPLYLQTNNILELLKKISNNGGVMSMIIPIDSNKYKLPFSTSKFVTKLYKQIPNNIWKCSMSEFDDFWATRNSIVFRYQINNKQISLYIYSPKNIDGLTFTTNNISLNQQHDIDIKGNKFSVNVRKGFNKWLINIK